MRDSLGNLEPAGTESLCATAQDTFHAMKGIRSLLALTGLMAATGSMPSAAPIPALLLGRFIDDYGIPHVITDSTWELGARDRYLIVSSNDALRYLVARNDAGNRSDAGKWTRIDWIPLSDMAPYEWAFCLIEYKADTREQAEAASSANPAHPRTGCNGFPFSRMRRAHADSTDSPQY